MSNATAAVLDLGTANTISACEFPVDPGHTVRDPWRDPRAALLPTHHAPLPRQLCCCRPAGDRHHANGPEQHAAGLDAGGDRLRPAHDAWPGLLRGGPAPVTQLDLDPDAVLGGHGHPVHHVVRRRIHPRPRPGPGAHNPTGQPPRCGHARGMCRVLFVTVCVRPAVTLFGVRFTPHARPVSSARAESSGTSTSSSSTTSSTSARMATALISPAPSSPPSRYVALLLGNKHLLLLRRRRRCSSCGCSCCWRCWCSPPAAAILLAEG